MAFGLDVAPSVTDERLALIEQQAPTSNVGKMLIFPVPQLNPIIPSLDLGEILERWHKVRSQRYY